MSHKSSDSESSSENNNGAETGVLAVPLQLKEVLDKLPRDMTVAQIMSFLSQTSSSSSSKATSGKRTHKSPRRKSESEKSSSNKGVRKDRSNVLDVPPNLGVPEKSSDNPGKRSLPDSSHSHETKSSVLEADGSQEKHKGAPFRTKGDLKQVYLSNKSPEKKTQDSTQGSTETISKGSMKATSSDKSPSRGRLPKTSSDCKRRKSNASSSGSPSKRKRKTSEEEAPSQKIDKDEKERNALPLDSPAKRARKSSDKEAPVPKTDEDEEVEGAASPDSKGSMRLVSPCSVTLERLSDEDLKKHSPRKDGAESSMSNKTKQKRKPMPKSCREKLEKSKEPKAKLKFSFPPPSTNQKTDSVFVLPSLPIKKSLLTESAKHSKPLKPKKLPKPSRHKHKHSKPAKELGKTNPTASSLDEKNTSSKNQFTSNQKSVPEQPSFNDPWRKTSASMAVDPLLKLERAEEELDYGDDGSDDDALSIYADSVMFSKESIWTQDIEREYMTRKVYAPSVRPDSPLSTDSRSLSDMDLDVDTDMDEAKEFSETLKGDLCISPDVDQGTNSPALQVPVIGFPVENYIPSTEETSCSIRSVEPGEILDDEEDNIEASQLPLPAPDIAVHAMPIRDSVSKDGENVVVYGLPEAQDVASRTNEKTCPDIEKPSSPVGQEPNVMKMPVENIQADCVSVRPESTVNHTSNVSMLTTCQLLEGSQPSQQIVSPSDDILKNDSEPSVAGATQNVQYGSGENVRGNTNVSGAKLTFPDQIDYQSRHPPNFSEMSVRNQKPCLLPDPIYQETNIPQKQTVAHITPQPPLNVHQTVSPDNLNVVSEKREIEREREMRKREVREPSYYPPHVYFNPPKRVVSKSPLLPTPPMPTFTEHSQTTANTMLNSQLYSHQYQPYAQSIDQPMVSGGPHGHTQNYMYPNSMAKPPLLSAPPEGSAVGPVFPTAQWPLSAEFEAPRASQKGAMMQEMHSAPLPPFNQSFPNRMPPSGDYYANIDCSKDVDMRKPDVDLRSGPTSQDQFEKFMSSYCREYLREGKCTKNHCHEFPKLDFGEESNCDVVYSAVKEMCSHLFFWMEHAFEQVVKDVSSRGNTTLLQKFADLLWNRDCQLELKNQKIFMKFSNHWKYLALGFRNCGIASDLCLTNILKIVISKSNVRLEVVDNIINAVYDDFIKGQPKVWEGVRKLAKLNGYEMPAKVLKEVLKDAIKHPKLKQRHQSIASYILSNNITLRPHKEDEAEVLHLIHNLTHIMSTNAVTRSLSEKLKEKYGQPDTGNCCDPPVNVMQQRTTLYPSESSVRFEIVGRESFNQPLSNLRNKIAQRNAQSVSKSPTPRKKEDVVTSSVVVSTMEEEVTSSTEGISAQPTTDLISSMSNMPKTTPHAPSYITQTKLPPIKIKVSGNARTITSCENPCPSNDGTQVNQREVLPESSKSIPAKLQTLNAVDSPKLIKSGARRPLREMGIPDLLREKKFGAASGIILRWRTVEEKVFGCRAVADTLSELDTQEIFSSYSKLLTAVLGHITEGPDVAQKTVTITASGLIIMKNFLSSNNWKEAYAMYQLVWSKLSPVLNQNEVFSQTLAVLLSAEVLISNGMVKEALDSVLSHNFQDCVEKWDCSWTEKDKKHRDQVFVSIMLKCNSMEAYVLQAEKLFREMMNAKESYSFDVGLKLFDGTLRALVRFKHFNQALNLLTWAHNVHDLSPNQITCRLLLIQFASMDEQEDISPQMMFILSQPPYKDALPQSVKDLKRVRVYLQSVWFTCEVQRIIEFLLKGHLCNLNTEQEIPAVSIEIKQAALPIPDPDQSDFPTGLLGADPSIQAMEHRVMTALTKEMLVTPNDKFRNNVIELDQGRLNDYVLNARNTPSARGRGGPLRQVVGASRQNSPVTRQYQKTSQNQLVSYQPQSTIQTSPPVTHQPQRTIQRNPWSQHPGDFSFDAQPQQGSHVAWDNQFYPFQGGAPSYGGAGFENDPNMMFYMNQQQQQYLQAPQGQPFFNDAPYPPHPPPHMSHPPPHMSHPPPHASRPRRQEGRGNRGGRAGSRYSSPHPPQQHRNQWRKW